VTEDGVKQGRLAGKWRRPVLWAIGWALLAIPVARDGLADVAMARHVPAQALALSPGNARALATLATALQLAGHQEQAVALARAALSREPMNVAALRTVGLAREALGDKAGADRAMMLAARLGWRDAALQLWLIKDYAQRGWVIDALRRADALARINKLPQITFPVLQAYLSDGQMRAALAAEMADRPFWRSLFFYHLLELPAERMGDVGQLVAALAKVGSPITPAERDIYLTRLVQVGQSPAALAYWAQDQRTQGIVNTGQPWDGGFERVPARGDQTAPFEWQLSPESASVASIAPGARGQQLVLSLGHDFNGPLISQTVVLAPGRYAITARVAGDAAAGGVHWSMHCVPSQDELPVDTGRNGGFPAATVAVPAGCPAQLLAIGAASGDDLGASGQVTVDDVAIRRIG
jgi:tetratricopeptide (TPR) repeat protein